MLKRETMEQLYDAVMEVLQDSNFREGELACSGDIGMNEFAGLPVVFAPAVPRAELHVAYTDKLGRRHIVKVLNIANELDAIEGAKRVRRIGPQTPEQIIADFEYRKKVDAALVADSRAEFERGEITEDELYTGDPLLKRNAYPLVFEAEIRGRKFGAWIPVPISVVRESPEYIERQAMRAQHLIKAEAVKYLDGLN